MEEVRFAQKFYKGAPDEFDSYCRRAYGKQMASIIARRLGHIKAVKSLADLLMPGFPGRWHWLTGDRKYQISADLKHPQRLIFEPTIPPKEYVREDGSINSQLITGLILIEIADTHV